MRAGSVVTRAALKLTGRPRAYGLYFAEGSRGKGMDRCPVRAIFPAGHDKEK